MYTYNDSEWTIKIKHACAIEKHTRPRVHKLSARLPMEYNIELHILALRFCEHGGNTYVCLFILLSISNETSVVKIA